MSWSLDQVRDLDEDEYVELLAWAQERSQRDEDGSMDADVIVEAKNRADRQTDEAEDE
jgi:hypothetical protein